MEREALNRLIADNLESLMAEKGTNPSAWAKAAGLSHTGVTDIIKGKVKNPTYLTLLKLARVVDEDVRRITIGPDYADLDADVAELIHVFSQLKPEERRFLLTAAKAQIDDLDSVHPELPSDNGSGP